jgi:hypothetical protein
MTLDGYHCPICSDVSVEADLDGSSESAAETAAPEAGAPEASAKDAVSEDAGADGG